MTPLSERFPISSFLLRDPALRAHDLDLLDRVVADWLSRDFRNRGLVFDFSVVTLEDEDARRRLLYHAALVRLESYLEFTAACEMPRTFAFAHSDSSESAIAFLIYLILSEWFVPLLGGQKAASSLCNYWEIFPYKFQDISTLLQDSF